MLLAAILIVAAGLRFGFLSSRGFWYDEALTAIGAGLDMPGLLRHLSKTETSPPLYFLLVNAWARVAGTSEAGLRSFSASLGVVTVWLAYATAARLVSIRAGLVAAALAAVNPMLVWFSLEARAYALLIALGGLSFLFFANALEKPRGRSLVGWTAASALAVWTHFFAVFLVAPEAVGLLFRHPRSRAIWGSLVALALTGGALLPYIVATKKPSWMAQYSWWERAARVPAEFLLGPQPPVVLVLAPIALLTPATALWLIGTRADAFERRGATLAALVGGTAVGVPALVALVTRFDVLMARWLSAATVPLLVVLAVGLGARRAGRVGVATVVLTCVLGVAIDLGTASVPKFEHEDWRGAARAIQPAGGPRALVLTPSRGHRPFLVYRPRAVQLTEPHAVVSEIVVVALPPVFRALGQPSLPPRPPSPPAEAPFDIVERVDADSFTLVRYRAAAPVRVDRARLAAMRLGAEEAAVLIEADD